ncbi:hypothetical protein RI065_07435 [Mycoplasmatota bacterium zrk1]
MKWTTMQLNRFINQEFVFDGDMDLSKRAESHDDIIRIEKVKVIGKMNIVDDRYIFDISISTMLYLECAITLEEVPFKISESFTEIFSVNPIDDENLIKGITVDLEDVIWLDILSLIPMRVVKEGVNSPFKSKVEEDKKNLAFKDLEKYL